MHKVFHLDFHLGASCQAIVWLAKVTARLTATAASQPDVYKGAAVCKPHLPEHKLFII